MIDQEFLDLYETLSDINADKKLTEGFHPVPKNKKIGLVSYALKDSKIDNTMVKSIDALKLILRNLEIKASKPQVNVSGEFPFVSTSDDLFSLIGNNARYKVALVLDGDILRTKYAAGYADWLEDLVTKKKWPWRWSSSWNIKTNRIYPCWRPNK